MDANKAVELVERIRELKRSQGAWLLNDEDVSEALKTVLEMAKERGRLRRGLEMLRSNGWLAFLNVNVLMLTDAQGALARVIEGGLRKVVSNLLDGKEWDGREAYTPPDEENPAMKRRCGTCRDHGKCKLESGFGESCYGQTCWVDPEERTK